MALDAEGSGSGVLIFVFAVSAALARVIAITTVDYECRKLGYDAGVPSAAIWSPVQCEVFVTGQRIDIGKARLSPLRESK